jgi:hypothetical protein
MGDGVTSSVNAPANQAGYGASSRSADSAAQTEFAKARQSAMADEPTSSEDLTNLCLPWDNDEAGLLKNVPPPRECLVPHPVISPEAMLDNDANAKPIEIPGETIEVHGKAPPESPLASAVRRGIAEVPTQDAFEKNLLRQANHFAKDWSIERWHNYIQGPPPEGFNEKQKFEWQKAATNWQEYVTKAYGQAWDKAEAKLLDNYRRIDVANNAVKSNLKFQLAGTFFAVVPAAGAVYGGWSAGVSGVEAYTGHKSGMQVADLASGNWGDHRKLSPPERVGLGAQAALGAITMGTGYALERSAGGIPRSGSNEGVVSGEIVSRELAGGAPHAPAQPKVIVDRSAYTVESGQAGMSKALGLDPSKTRTVALASDGHGADFHVVASPERPGGAARQVGAGAAAGGGGSAPPKQVASGPTPPTSNSSRHGETSPTSNPARPKFAATSKGDIAIDPGVGQSRELRVAEIVGGRVARAGNKDGKVYALSGEVSRVKGRQFDTLKYASKEGVTVDVFGSNQELIVVGGPAKAQNLSKLGGDLRYLKNVADQHGVKALAYFEEGTPQDVIDVANKWLGKENVHIFK